MNDYISREDALNFEMNLESENEQEMLGIVRGMRIYADYIKSLPGVGWVSVEERLPEEEKEVLVTRHFLSDNQLKKNAITESFYVEVASRIGDEWTSYSDEYKIKKHLHKVIAWMPLPEPPKNMKQDVIWCEDCNYFGNADMGGEGECSVYEKDTWYGCDATDCPHFKPEEE